MIRTTSFIHFSIGYYAIGMGVLLPYIRSAYSLNYSFSGVLVSCESIGKLIGSFIAVWIFTRFAVKRTSILTNLLTYIGYLIILLTGNRLLAVLAFLFMGFGRGCILYFGTDNMNRIKDREGYWTTFTQTFFALGALVAPFVLTICAGKTPIGWKSGGLTIILIGVISVILLQRTDMGWYEEEIRVGSGSTGKSIGGYGFLKKPVFLIVTVIGFCYMAFEASVMGWASTFFKDSGAVAENAIMWITALIWLGFLIGRIVSTKLVRYFESQSLVLVLALVSAVFYIFMLAGRYQIFTGICAFGVGLGFSGLYTLIIAGIGRICREYRNAMSFYMTVTLVGAVVLPSVIGRIAERSGILTAMRSLLVPLAVQIVLSAVHLIMVKAEKRAEKLK